MAMSDLGLDLEPPIPPSTPGDQALIPEQETEPEQSEPIKKFSPLSFDKTVLVSAFNQFMDSPKTMTSDIYKLACYYEMWSKREAPELYRMWKAIDKKYSTLHGKSRKFKRGELDERMDFITDFSNKFELLGYLPSKGQNIDVERPYILQDVIDDWNAHIYVPGGMVIIRGGKGSGKSNFQAQEAIRLAQDGYLVVTSNQLNLKTIERDFGDDAVKNIHYVNTIAQLLEVRAKDMLNAESRDELRTLVVFHDDMDMALGTLKATGVDMRNFTDFNILLRKLGICYVGTYHLLKVPGHVKTEVRVWINKGYYYDQYALKHDFPNSKQSYSIMVEDFNYPDVYGIPDYGPYFYTGATGDLSFSGTPIMELSRRLSRLTTDSPRAMGEMILKFLNIRINPWETEDAAEPDEFMDEWRSYTCQDCGTLWNGKVDEIECSGCHSNKLTFERTEIPRLPKEDFVRFYAGFRYSELTRALRSAGRSEGRPYSDDEFWYFKDKGFPDTVLAALYIKGRKAFPTKDEQNGSDDENGPDDVTTIENKSDDRGEN